MNEFSPSRLLLQWHLSDRCNLRCSHCYQASYQGEERGIQDWGRVVDDYLLFLHTHQIKRGFINLTGGEPLALRDFPALIELLINKPLDVGVLCNGALIDRDMARQLRLWGVHSVQVSIEGGRETHDRIRGPGQFDQAVAGLQALLAEGIKTVISFTAQRANWREFGEVARLGQALGVFRVWADRLIPSGQASLDEVLQPDEVQAFFQLMQQAQASKPVLWAKRSPVSMHRALQFIEGDDRVYRCTAGNTLITIMPDGTLYPCRRLPIAVGNVYQTSLLELYRSELFEQLRNPHWVSTGCEQCIYQSVCRGGLRCLAYAVTGDLYQADPGCWLAAAATATTTSATTRVSAATAASA